MRSLITVGIVRSNIRSFGESTDRVCNRVLNKFGGASRSEM